MTDAVHPEAGDLVSYRDRRYGTFGHVGRVLARRGGRVRVRTTAGPVRVLDLDDVEGYWPRGSRKHSLEALREVIR